MNNWLLVAAGLVLLFGGGESLVRGAVGLSRRFGISELVIGLTVVGFGTSMPELLVSVDAALSDNPGIALGNVIGSNTANILLILGISTLIKPIAGWDRSIMRDLVVMMGASVFFYLLAQTGVIGAKSGTLMLLLLITYLVYAFRNGSGTGSSDGAEMREATHLGWLAAVTLAGLAALFAGAGMLVDGASAIAVELGVSQAVIGLTIVAIGTSLPEMATSVIAAIRGNAAVSLGNIVGSNIFNILGILGITSVIRAVPVPASMLQSDIPVMMGAALLLTILLWRAKPLNRPTGALMLAAYAAYTAWLFGF